MKRYRVVPGVILLLAVLILGGIVAGFINYSASQAATAALPSPTPVQARPSRADVIAATASIVPALHSTLAFPIGGRLVQVAVREGDAVKKGQVLARLDTSVQDVQALQAQAALEVARQQLALAQQSGSVAARAAAAAELDAARKNLDRVKAGPSGNEVALLKANEENARAGVNQAQAAYDRAGGDSNPQSAMLPQRLALEQAHNAYDAAAAAYAASLAHPTDAEIAAALAQVRKAEAQVANMTPDPASVALVQAQVKQAETAVELAKANLENASLIAPFDGTVIKVTANIGEVVSPGAPAVMIADLNQLQAETNGLADVDVPQVHLGADVNVSVEAFPGRIFHGTIVSIAPMANDSHGQQVFTVKVNLKEGVAEGLRWGMNAQVEIADHE